MFKSEFIKEIAREADFTQAETARFLEAFQEVVTNALAEGDEVMLTGFGCFSVRRKPARTMLSFGKEIEVPAKKSIVFKAGRTLKDAVN